MNFKKTPRMIFGLALLAGCASPPTNFYTLEPLNPSIEAPATMRGSSTVQIQTVSLPGVLDRVQIVRDAGNARIDVAPQDRWAAPLDELTLQTLSSDLARLLPAGRVAPPDAAAVPGAALIAVDIDRFASDLEGNIVLDATWTASIDGKSGPRYVEHFEEKASGKDFSAIATGMSRVIADLAASVAGKIP